MSFKYKIENREVKIESYTGTSQRVVIPNFVSTICRSAFNNTGVLEIKLNEKLKYIGSYAFKECNIKEIVIPESVEIICKNALMYNRQETYIANSGFNTKVVRIMNKDTIII